jgi:carbon storage regulator CsrA
MLILSRKVDESIVFQGLDIEVIVTSIDPDQGRVKLGIKAPQSVKVFRHELLERMDPWVIQERPKGVADVEPNPHP